MTGTHTNHNPLVSGIKVRASAEGRESDTGNDLTSGTLTGLATRRITSGETKVLVTNWHIVTGGWADGLPRSEVLKAMKLYQPDVATNNGDVINEVGFLNIWRSHDKDNPNFVDVVAFELTNGRQADFTMHVQGERPHIHLPRRWIVAGCKDPSKGMTVKILGAASGEKDVTITEVKGVSREDRKVFQGFDFRGLIKLDCNQSPVQQGDSGAPCLWKDANGKYHMVGIFFASENNGKTGWAFPASVAENMLNITFGKRPPIANAGPDQTVDSEALVTLDGSLSSDPDGEPLSYLWEQDRGPEYAPDTPVVTIENNASKIATFTAPPSSERGQLTFKLTVKDVAGQTHSDTVDVNRNPVAKITAPATVVVGTEGIVLDGSFSPLSVAASFSTADDFALSWKPSFLATVS